MSTTSISRPISSGRRAGRARRAVAVAVAGSTAAAALLTVATPAHAERPGLTVVGLGTATTTAGGASYAGEAGGVPIDGIFEGSFAAADGSLPALGECEPAAATLRVDHRKAHYALASTGEVCAWFLPLGTMYQLTGRWTVTSTSGSAKRVAGLTGIFDIRVLGDQSDVYATS